MFTATEAVGMIVAFLRIMINGIDRCMITNHCAEKVVKYVGKAARVIPRGTLTAKAIHASMKSLTGNCCIRINLTVSVLATAFRIATIIGGHCINALEPPLPHAPPLPASKETQLESRGIERSGQRPVAEVILLLALPLLERTSTPFPLTLELLSLSSSSSSRPEKEVVGIDGGGGGGGGGGGVCGK